MVEERKKVLIVEDEAPVRRIISDMIAPLGCEIIEAKDGESGLQKGLDNHPDVIILDIVMPGKGGLEMAEELRKDEWGRQVPVVILTNLKTARQSVEELGGEIIFIPKADWEIEDVVKVVKEILEVKDYLGEDQLGSGILAQKVRERLGFE